MIAYVGAQTAVLYEDYDEELRFGPLINALCGIGKSSLTLGRNPILVLQAVTDTVGSPIGRWFSSPGCWTHSPK